MTAKKTDKECGWCTRKSLQAKCLYCDGQIIICHNSVDCFWTHRKGNMVCDIDEYGRDAFPQLSTIEPSTTDDIPKPTDIKQYPVAIVATTKRSGETYGRMLGIENYRIILSPKEVDGLRVRAVIITPGYFDMIESARHKAMLVLDRTIHTGLNTNAPRG